MDRRSDQAVRAQGVSAKASAYFSDGVMTAVSDEDVR